MNEIIIPKSLDSEQVLLGTLIEKPEAIHEIPDISVFHFFSSVHKVIFKAIKKLQSEGAVVDLVSVVDEVKKIDQKVEGSEVADVFDAASSPSAVKSYANIIRDKYSRRWLQRKCNNTANYLGKIDCNADEAAVELLLSVSKFVAMCPKTPFHLADTCESTWKELQEATITIKTGIGRMKFNRRQINVIAGRPGHWKTTSALQIASNLVQSGLEVDFFSLEMPVNDLIGKLACNLAGVSHKDMREGLADDKDQEAVRKSLDYIKSSFGKLRIYDEILTPEQIIRIAKQNEPDVMIIDYLQLLPEDQDRARTEINRTLRKFKSFIKSTNICMILLSQLSRDIDKRVDERPRLSDLAESGHIEQFASDIVALYYNHKVRYKNSKDGPNVLRAYTLKGRYGDTYSIALYVNPATGRIRTLEESEREELNKRWEIR